MSNDNKTNLKAHDGAQAGKRGLLLMFTIFMAWVAGFGLLLSLVACKPASAKQIATEDSSGYDALTTNYSAVNPNRHSLDIFMPKICLINYQQITTGINKLALRFKRHTYATGHSAVRYGGISEPNKTPLVGNKLRRLNTIVNILPLPFFKHHHQTTTNYSGGYHA